MPVKFNRRPDSFESADARAALPQNCSIAKLDASPKYVNGTTVPEPTHQSATGIILGISKLKASLDIRLHALAGTRGDAGNKAFNLGKERLGNGVRLGSAGTSG
jgi:hypothetical protein